MKILFAINDLGTGGAEKTMVFQANFLQERGFDVYFLTFQKKDSDFNALLKINESRRILMPFSSYFNFVFWRQLVSFLRRGKFDVIISALYLSNFLIRTASFFAPKNRIIVREANLPWNKKFHNKLFDFILAAKTEQFICPSQAVADALAHEQYIVKEKLFVLYNGIEKDWFTCTSSGGLKQNINAQDNDLILASVGSLTPKKGHTYLIEAISEFKKEMDNFRLVLVGGGPEEHNLKMLTEKLGLQNYIYFLGRKDRNEIKDILRQADIFVLPSRWEGLPNALLEAMAVGLPCVATQVGGNAEIINNGVNGVLVESRSADLLAEALIKVGKNLDWRKALATEAKKTAGKFTWEKNFQGLLTLVNKK